MEQELFGIDRYIKKILTERPDNEFQIDSIEYQPDQYSGMSALDPSYREPSGPPTLATGILRDTAASAGSRSAHHKAIYNLLNQGRVRLVRLDTKYFDFANGNPQNQYLPDAKPIFDALGAEWLRRKGSKLRLGSGYRGPSHRLHRSGGSSHDVGMAADFWIDKNNQRLAYELADLAYSMKGFGGIAMARGNSWMIHLDVGKYGRWSYSDGRYSPRYQSPAERRGH